MTRAVAIALLLGAAGTAEAYPHFQVTSGTPTCGQCHFNPGGGGLLTDWGRDASADVLSGNGGNGDFFHGLVPLPRWLSVGGDVRLAGLAHDTGATEGVQLAAFPMQADLSARIGSAQLWGLVTVGYRGSARQPAPPDPSAAPAPPSPLASVISREHYFAWTPGNGAYLRAGRFFAPYGLRLADHTAYVRRYLGFNLLEETYGLGGGLVTDGWEVHATGFASDPFRPPARSEFGGALHVEARLGEVAVLGASGRIGASMVDTRTSAGALLKLWLAGPHLLWMMEVDGAYQRFRGPLLGASRYQLAAYAGPVWMPVDGLSAGAAYELFDEDLLTRGVERHAVGLWVSYLPWAHVEVMLSGRAQLIGPSDRALTAMLQLHYFL